MMSKKDARLYHRINFGKARRTAAVDTLKSKRQKN